MSMIKFMSAHLLPGYALGLPQSAAVAYVHLLPEARDMGRLSSRLRSILATHLPPEHPGLRPTQPGPEKWQSLAFEISVAVAGIGEAAGIPVLDRARINAVPSQDPDLEGVQLQLAMPSLVPAAAVHGLRWVLDLTNALATDDNATALSADQCRGLDVLIDSLVPSAPTGSNSIRFIRAAHGLGIPYVRLPGNLFQFGWGHRGRWFNSSITEETAAIAALITKNKALTNATLRMAGLPVPAGQLAPDEAQAIEIASKLGYPVVVKPADLDQGRGVAVDLRDAGRVGDAFRQALELSRHVLVEKHMPGTAFRVTVFRGQTVIFVRRIPAGVTGDGTSTIAALVAKANEDPRRSSRRFSIMKPIVLDDEALAMLAESDMSASSVPGAGVFMALKRAANLSTGGDAVMLGENEVHPGYRALAEKAAKVLRLDVAGIDLVTPDIHQPWQQAGGVIIEVNAQPQMGSILTHIHAQLLQLYVQGDGTIPSVLVMGAEKVEIVRHLQQSRDGGAGMGIVSSDGCFIGQEQLAIPGSGDIPGVTALLMDPTVSSLVLATDGQDFSREGLPLPFFDHLCLTDWMGETVTLASTLALIKPHLRGNVFMKQGHTCQALILRTFGQQRVRILSSAAAMAKATASLLISKRLASG